MKKKIGIIGAGFAGLSTANIFKLYGFDVTVYEKDKEVGGVWATSQRYPGLSTQNTKDTYYLADLKMPKQYPEWPSGKQVQNYLESYTDKQDLRRLIRFNTEVTSAHQERKNKWIVKWRSPNQKDGVDVYDYLIICNGIFCKPFIPNFNGAETFKSSGGKIVHTTQFHNESDAEGKNIVVIGFGKSSCDVANALAPIAKSMTVVAREIIWKLPRIFFGFLNFKYLFLTRMGENLIKYIDLKGFPKFLHTLGKPVRNFLVNSIEKHIEKQLKLRKRGLHPGTKFETITRANVSQVTAGFFEKVGDGSVVVKKTDIKKLNSRGLVLANGEEIPADIIICGTGFKQEVPFLDKSIDTLLFDENKDFFLYKNQLPIGTQHLGFNGYNSSFYSPLSSEVGALWMAEYFTSGFSLPGQAEMIRATKRKLAWSKARTLGKNARGTNIIPFSMHHVDELLEDLKMNLSTFKLFNQWNVPASAKDYKKIINKKAKRFHKGRAASFHS